MSDVRAVEWSARVRFFRREVELHFFGQPSRSLTRSYKLWSVYPRFLGPAAGCFGAALMKDAALVRDIVHRIGREVQIPVTVKTRIGYDHCESHQFLHDFIQTVSAGGCRHFIIHARKAWLKGVDPKKNRSVPPLMYERVYYLCDQFPDLDFSLNGGVKSVKDAIDLVAGNWSDGTAETDALLRRVTKDKSIKPLKGVMIGRAAAADPCVLAGVDTEFYGLSSSPPSATSRRSVLHAYGQYLKRCDPDREKSVFPLLKPVVGVLSGMPGHRLFRFTLDRIMREKSHGMPAHAILQHAVSTVDESYPGVLDCDLGLPKECRYDKLPLSDTAEMPGTGI
ncbi:dihydrouridine synthase [Cystoisospora suis]|uniref:Dihydrouridine synthase n=1 Tax=Cystoisospora suis TaxID=483139 RepID=A0A2C6KIQ8_9APIC|nr:dihydrouridine synthase [Cystoisospora suis]